MPSDIALYINILLSILALVCGVIALIFSRSNRTLRKLIGKDPNKELDSILDELASKIEALETASEINEQLLKQTRTTLESAVQHFGLVKFNAMAREGGNLSFSLALLDANQTGIVITSMYGREGNRLYIKQLSGGQSESQLSEEEQKAVATALKSK